jgi:predicted DNA-binding transcriptional regulator AlpA
MRNDDKAIVLGNIHNIAKKHEISWTTARRWTTAAGFPAPDKVEINRIGNESGWWNMAAVDAWVDARNHPKTRTSNLLCISTMTTTFKVSTKTVYRWLKDPNFPPHDGDLQNSNRQIVKGWKKQTVQRYINATPGALSCRRARNLSPQIPQNLEETVSSIRIGDIFVTAERRQQILAKRMSAHLRQVKPLYSQSVRPDWYYQD